MTKASIQGKELVKLRQRELKNGNITLYPGIHINGRPNWEYLMMYLIDNPVAPPDKKNKNEILQFAQAV